MPLVIRELIAHVESPAENEEQWPTPTGVETDQKQGMDALKLKKEREERLTCD